MLVKLEINNKDPSYPWFLAWMSHQANNSLPTSASPYSFLTGTGTTWLRSHQLSVETILEKRANGSSTVDFMLVAGPGTHIFKYQGAWIQLKREREVRATAITTGVPWETITLTTLSRDRSLFPSLLAEARDISMKGKEGKLIVYTARGFAWEQFGLARQKRPLDSVILGPGVREKIEGDVRAFLDRREWYAERGSSGLFF